MPPLRRTYASLSLDTPSQIDSQSTSQSTANKHDTSALSVVPPVPSPIPTSQPKVGKPIVKLPSTLPRPRSSLLSPRRSSLHRWSSLHHRSSHLDRQIFPHFKPGLNLYRRVLTREFKKAIKKAIKNNVEAPTTRHNDDQ